MMPFSIGDRVFIRHGARRNQSAEIIGVQPAQVYTVKLADGSFLWFSSGGLRLEREDRPSTAGYDRVGTPQASIRN